MSAITDFFRNTPVLYGQIMQNGKSKIGSFRQQYNPNSNSFCYQYYTPEGNKGRGGFSSMKAYKLWKIGKLSTDPAMGDPTNYI